MEQRNAFVDASTGVLKTHGFVESNQDGDIKIAVAEDFDLQPGKWKRDGDQWVPV